MSAEERAAFEHEDHGRVDPRPAPPGGFDLRYEDERGVRIFKHPESWLAERPHLAATVLRFHKGIGIQPPTRLELANMTAMEFEAEAILREAYVRRLEHKRVLGA